MKFAEKIMLCLQAAAVFLLIIFSYSYVDLNLTLSSNPQILFVISSLQHIAYYQRPLATTLYLILLAFCFGVFILNLYLFTKNKLSKKYLFTNIVVSTLALVFSYPFLSSDIFNYMFDAKIITFYHQSPYLHKALDYPNDDWIRFMRWVHRYSPYGPLWLVLSILPTLAGLGKFITTLFAFKFFIGTFHIINSALIYKILQKQNAKNILFKTSLYGLNPLFLIEGVINSHNDVVIATFLLLAIYFALKSKITATVSSLLLGTLTKYITILNLPWFVYYFLFDKRKNLHRLILFNFLTMAGFTIFYSNFQIQVPFISSSGLQVQFQPWYLFWTLPLAALIANSSMIILFLTTSASVFLRYLPYIFYGDWSQPGTIQFMQYVTVLPTIFVGAIMLIKMLVVNMTKISQKIK